MPGPERKKDNSFIESSWGAISQAHRFQHQAMASSWEIIIQHEDAEYAREASLAAFDELDRLESELSRFVENSDISRIKSLHAGRSAVVGLDTFGCLKTARQMYKKTGGAFDVTIGPLYQCWFDENSSPSVHSPMQSLEKKATGKKLREPTQKELDEARKRTGMELLELNEQEHSVKVKTGHLQLDLGGIGKGYAVDRMAEILRDWRLNRAFINGGSSSVLALDAPLEMKGWPVTISSPFEPKNTLNRLFLKNFSLGGSGLQTALHIIDPRTGRPVSNKVAAWSGDTKAVSTDALSTAFMTMSNEQIEHYCKRHPKVIAMTMQRGARCEGQGIRSGKAPHVSKGIPVAVGPISRKSRNGNPALLLRWGLWQKHE